MSHRDVPADKFSISGLFSKRMKKIEKKRRKKGINREYYKYCPKIPEECFYVP